LQVFQPPKSGQSIAWIIPASQLIFQKPGMQFPAARGACNPFNTKHLIVLVGIAIIAAVLALSGMQLLQVLVLVN